MLVVHYHRKTGEIANWGTGDSPGEVSHVADHLIARMANVAAEDVDPSLHKVDIVYGCIADKSLSERLVALAPHVSAAILRELTATDAMMVPDRPMSEPLRESWKAYRQSLRDLSKDRPDAASMVRAWPSRPDGVFSHRDLVDRLALIEGSKQQ